MTTDAKDFLVTLLCLAEAHERESGERRHCGSIRDCTIHDMHPEFLAALEQWIQAFKNFLEAKQFDMTRLDSLRRSFGGNLYFSLSGHGCGFWDEEDGDDLDELLEEFSGNDLRFHELEYSLWKTKAGVSLAYKKKYLSEYVRKLFEFRPLP